MYAELLPYAAVAAAVIEGTLDPVDFYRELPKETAKLLDAAMNKIEGRNFLSLSRSDQKRAIFSLLAALGHAHVVAKRAAGGHIRVSPRPRLSGWLVKLGIAAAVWVSAAAIHQIQPDFQLRGIDSANRNRPPSAKLADLREIESRVVAVNDQEPDGEGAAGPSPEIVKYDVITAAIGGENDFRELLEEHVRRFPNTERSQGFRRTIVELRPVLSLISAGNRLLVELHKSEQVQRTPAAARRLTQECKSQLEACGDLRGADQVRERLPVIAAIANRVDSAGTKLQARLIEYFQQPQLSLTFVLLTKSGKRYYFAKRPVTMADAYVSDYAVDAELSTKPARIRKNESALAASGRSAHVGVAAKVVEALSAAEQRGLEESFGAALEVVEQATGLDPLLRVLWLDRILVVGCSGSEPMPRRFGQHREVLERVGLNDDVNWLDPADQFAHELRSTLANESVTMRSISQPTSAALLAAEGSARESLPSLDSQKPKWAKDFWREVQVFSGFLKMGRTT